MSQDWIVVEDAICRISQSRHLRVARFRLSSGQHWSVFGGNGAGKTLFADYLAGRLRSGSGRVHYPGDLDPARDIAVVSFERQQVLQSLDQRHDISEYNAAATDAGTTVRALLHPAGQDDRTQAVSASLIEELGLTGILQQGIRSLSSGQMRRAMLAAALLRRPRLLILDEPLESIDRGSRQRITDALTRWQSADNASLVLNRRRAGLLPGMTHMALMRGLSLVAVGTFEALQSRIDEVLPPLPPVPAGLPGPAVSHVPEPLPVDQPLIHLQDVSVRFGNHLVLDRLSWTFHPGQHTLIEGPNGCGKSTLLALITGGSHKAYGQSVWLFGRRRGSGESVWEVKSRFGVVSNELHVQYLRGWKVIDVVVSGFFDSVGLYRDAGASEVEVAREWLRAVGLEGLNSAGYHEISFGQQRLVLLVRAMVKQPPVLVLDEPCVGLDDRYRSRILELVDRIARGGRTQLLYVSHTTGEAPRSINQWMRFERRSGGTFQVRITP
ncbi:MAG: ATP-binding cassette domain-containing protein [Pseudomonadota bacterium]